MNLETIKMLLPVGQFLITCATGVWLYFDRRNDTTQTRIISVEKAIGERVDDLSNRMAKVEAQQLNAVTHADLGPLKEDVASTKALIEGMSKQVDRIDNYLLNNR